MKILIATDAWFPQVNGVVTTLHNTISILRKEYSVIVMHPELFQTIPCPTYPEIKIPFKPWKIIKFLKEVDPDIIHIPTEGVIGLTTKLFCDYYGYNYTTSYHTKFPEYVDKRIPGTLNLVYKYLKWFHKKSKSVLVTTNSMKEELENKGFKNLNVWTRGVDRKIFKSKKKPEEPVLIYVGRISVEKNIEAFLDIDLPYKKIVVGDGPQLQEYKTMYPEVEFLGALSGTALSDAYNLGTVFVFPSKTDTFGLVQIEANACGLPIAAYPVTGPKDVIVQGKNGYMSEDLKEAVLHCLWIKKKDILAISSRYTWNKCSKIFLETLVQKNEKTL